MLDAIWIDANLATMAGGTSYAAIEKAAIGVEGRRIAWVGPQAALPDMPERIARVVHLANGGWISPVQNARTKPFCEKTMSQVISGQYPWPYDARFGPSDTALLVLDMQEDLCSPRGRLREAGFPRSDMMRIVTPIGRVLAAMRAMGFPAMFTSEGHRADLSDLPEAKRRRWVARALAIGSPGPRGRFLVRGEAGSEIVPELRPHSGEPVIEKTAGSGFFASNLETVLRNKNILHLVIAGVTTDGTVQATMRDANDRGYECLLLEDCCAAFDEEVHRAALLALKGERAIYGVVASSDSLLRALA
jgi:nicotinamidase-related amidase